jgi:hypothetical protein
MPHRRDLAPDAIQAILSERAPAIRGELTGPIRVESIEHAGRPGTRCEATAAVFVPLEDAERPDLGIPLPVRIHAALTAAGQLESLEIDEPTPEARRQAQAYGHAVLASGAVSGEMPSAMRRGPPARPTHAIRTDERGRLVLVRVGFSE